MSTMELQKILDNHKLWLMNEGGERADLSGADLRGADLSGADLSSANLKYATLSDTNLSSANLKYATLSGAYLKYANLSSANLSSANLSSANLSGVNLSSANLSGTNLSNANLKDANLSGVVYNECTAFFASQCPEEGSFVAWKKCQGDVLVKLLIPEDAKRSSSTTRKCRASKVIVLEVIGAEIGISAFDTDYVYEKGKTVVADSFDDNKWDECSHGIHFFITRKEAENYN